jgi:predicted anti-sigma-YlaC factor YlaD
MNCEKCHELLSDFLDGAMSSDDKATFNAHLEECLPCFNVHEEMNTIVTFCRENRGDYEAPPNADALWLRIRNIVESESMQAAAAAQNPNQSARRESWWSRAMGRSWELSLPQVAMAVVAIIIVASLATIFGLRGLQKVGVDNVASANPNNARTQTASLTYSNNGAKALDVNNRLWQQQQQIRYLSQIVEERKAHWSPKVREDFEHNLTLLDETVEESLQKLSRQPHDEVTEEMLNAALSDKMQLLKEFSDL